MYDLVADIESYPEFIPWCDDALIRNQVGKGRSRILEADLIVAFKVFKECFRSEVTLMPDDCLIRIRYLDGPLKYLRSYWSFHPHGQGCQIEYHVDFEFRSKIVQKVIGLVFLEAMQKIVLAFENRARTVYGS